MMYMPVLSGIRRRVCAWGVLAAFPTLLWGQNPVVPQGGEFSILGAIPGDQVLSSLSFSSGRGCVAWQDNVVDGNLAGIGGALMNNSLGAGRMFRANNTKTGDQLEPQVQMLANSNMVVVWQSRAGGIPGIYARLAKNGTNFYTLDTRLNTYIADQVRDPAVAGLPDGSALVVWSSYGQDGSMWGVYARKLLATGKGATAKEFLVNQYTAFNQRNPAVATLANGNYVIAWVSEQERFLNSVDIYARVFTSAGVAVTGEIPINSGSNICSRPSVAPLNDGGFTVVWSQKDVQVPTNSWDVWGRAFSAIGQPEVSDFRINTYLYGDQFQPRIASGPTGALVVWTSLAQDGSREGVFGRFLRGGTQVSGGEFQVNTTWISQQIHPAVAWNGLDRFLVVWSSFVGSSGFDLYGQAYVLNSSP
jgi:hypothetical protein